MYIEMLIIAIIIIYIFIVNGKINKNSLLSSDSKLCNLLKEKDYDFLLIAKYGDRVYNPNEVYIKRIKEGIIVGLALIFVFLSQVNYLTIIIAIVIGFLVYKYQYISLKKWYRGHLSYIDSLLPYYLKTLEVLVHHYTVPVALARSIDDAPEVFKPGLKRLVEKIESLTGYSLAKSIYGSIEESPASIFSTNLFNPGLNTSGASSILLANATGTV